MEFSFTLNPQFKTLISPHFNDTHQVSLSTTSAPIEGRITAARKNPRRATLRISTKAALECALFIASSLKVIPEPVSLMLKEGISGGDGDGDGGGNGVWNGFGGGGFDGWRMRRRRKLGIWGVVALIAIGVVFVVLMVGKDFGGYGELGLVGLVVLGLGMLEREWRRGDKGWVLGFCSCGLMVVLGFKKEELKKWGQRSGAGSSLMDLFKKKRRRRRFL